MLGGYGDGPSSCRLLGEGGKGRHRLEPSKLLSDRFHQQNSYFKKGLRFAGHWRELLPGTSKKPKTFLPLALQDPLGRPESQETHSLYMKSQRTSTHSVSFWGPFRAPEIQDMRSRL